MRPRDLPLLLSSACMAAMLVACATSGNYHKDAAHQRLLDKLRQCLVEIPVHAQKDKDFYSPCVGTDVSPLNGIPRSKLIEALGPAQYCSGETQGTGFPKNEDCLYEENPQWSFYRLTDPTIRKGPELICEANRHLYCETVEWRRSG